MARQIDRAHLSELIAGERVRFADHHPRSRKLWERDEAALAEDPVLDEYLHLFALNRGILMTPFHNMALMAPDTTAADVDRHSEVFRKAGRPRGSCGVGGASPRATSPNV